MPITIGIDFDGTYTADADLWDKFIADARARGHRVFCVTARRYTKENARLCDVPGALTYFTELAPKAWYMREKQGIKIDIWIDDDPSVIINGH